MAAQTSHPQSVHCHQLTQPKTIIRIHIARYVICTANLQLTLCIDQLGNCHTLQVGSYAAETATWTRPEDMTTSRPNITISTVNATSTAAADLVGNAAAALAAASMAWESVNSTYAAQALLAAKDLYTFAQSVSVTQLLNLSCSVFTVLIGVVHILPCNLSLSLSLSLSLYGLPVVCSNLH